MSQPNQIGPITLDTTTGTMSGPAGVLTLAPALRTLASCFWQHGQGVAFPFSTLRETLWAGGLTLPSDPEQAFRHDLRELRIITRALAYGSGLVLDFREDKAKNWLVKLRRTA